MVAMGTWSEENDWPSTQWLYRLYNNLFSNFTAKQSRFEKDIREAGETPGGAEMLHNVVEKQGGNPMSQ